MNRLTTSITAVLICGAFLVGCGGDDKTDPEAFMQGFCRDFTTYTEAVTKVTTDLNEALGEDISPEKGQAALQVMVEGVKEATETFRDSVTGLGVPDVENGEDVSDAIVTAMQDVLDVLDAAADDIAGLPVDDPEAFRQAADGLATQIVESFSKIGGALEEVDTEELEDIFNSEPECAALR